MSKKLNIEYVRETVSSFGYELISDYKGVNDIIRVRNEKGEEYNVRFSHIREGSQPENRVIKKTQDEVKLEFSSFGYLLMSEYKSNNARVDVMCVNGHIYKTSRAEFTRGGGRCRICDIGLRASRGEKIVISTLSGNGDIINDLKREVTVLIGDEKHRFDFMFSINGDKYALEVDGEFHYKDKSYFFKEDGEIEVKKRLDRDAKKDMYCKNNNISMIRVQYSAYTSEEDFFNRLNDSLPVELKRIQLNDPKRSEIAEYALTHSYEDTGRNFNVNKNTVLRYFRLVYGKTKQEYIYDEYKDDIVEYYIHHSMKEVMDKFPMIEKSRIPIYFKQVHGMTKSQYIKANKEG